MSATPQATVRSDATDAELSAAVAQYVLGREVELVEPGEFSMSIPDPKAAKAGFDSWGEVPPFSTSADAVLPLLEKLGQWDSDYLAAATLKKRVYAVTLGSNRRVREFGPTFARAACFALLKAHGVTVTDGK